MATGAPASMMELIFGVLDRLFRDNASGKLLFSRVFSVVVIFVLCLIWYKGEDMIHAYHDMKYESYRVSDKKDRDINFTNSALEQLQIVQASSGADLSAIYVFRPTNMNYFVDMIMYEGRLPSTVNSKNLGGFPIDRTSPEYQTHLTGEYFVTDTEFTYLPTKKKDGEIKKMFSCPYFNLDNVYSGSVSMYWYENVNINQTRLATICRQASRTLGRAR